jgi:hypothetical protein
MILPGPVSQRCTATRMDAIEETVAADYGSSGRKERS